MLTVADVTEMSSLLPWLRDNLHFDVKCNPNYSPLQVNFSSLKEAKAWLADQNQALVRLVKLLLNQGAWKFNG